MAPHQEQGPDKEFVSVEVLKKELADMEERIRGEMRGSRRWGSY